METTEHSITLAPFSTLFRQSVQLTVSKTFSLIIAVLVSSLLSLVIMFIAVLPLPLLALFVNQASSRSEIAFTLLLLAIGFIIAFGGVIYQSAYKFKTYLLVLAGGKSGFDAAGSSFLSSFGLTFTIFFTWATLVGGFVLTVSLAVFPISLTKYLSLVVVPAGFILLLCLSLLLFMPYISVLEGKNGFAALSETLKLTKANIFRILERFLLFYTTLLIVWFGMKVFVLGPLLYLQDYFSWNGLLGDIILYLPTLFTLLFAIFAPFVKLAFVLLVYKSLRVLNPVSTTKPAKSQAIPLYFSSALGMVLSYLLLLGITTLSFYILKPRALFNALKVPQRIEETKTEVKTKVNQELNELKTIRN